MQYLYARLCVAQLFFAMVLWGAPSSVKASSATDSRSVMRQVHGLVDHTDIPMAFSAEEYAALPVFTKTLSFQN